MVPARGEAQIFGAALFFQVMDVSANESTFPIQVITTHMTARSGRYARCCATTVPRFTQVSPASVFEYQFHHPEVIAEDPALTEKKGCYSCQRFPRKPDVPRKCDQRD